MTDAKSNDIISNFFQIFTNSIEKTLSKDLDADICTKIQFIMKSLGKARDVENLKENNALYKLDYTTGKQQGSLIILFPEELIASISDILTGGSGKDPYKGILSEIETNSISKILEKVFKHIENDFKKYYEHDLVFSSEPVFLLKETPEYKVISKDFSPDFLITNTLNLNPDTEYSIGLLLNKNILESLMNDLGLTKTGGPARKTDMLSLDVSRLSDVKINVTAELGRARVPIKYALELVRGSLVELDTLNNADIKVFANGVEFAHAQVVAVEDNFGLKITKIIPPEERLEYV